MKEQFDREWARSRMVFTPEMLEKAKRARRARRMHAALMSQNKSYSQTE